MPEYNKLIRDKIPEIITKQEKNFMTVHLSDEKWARAYLIDKLFEECEEFEKNPSIEEMADIFEVIDELMQRYNISLKDVLKAKRLKREERGGFKDNIVLVRVED